jgi:hypothetical protein
MVSSVRWHLVLRRDGETIAVLGTWTRPGGWILDAAGCAATSLARVLPAVVERAQRMAGWPWCPAPGPGPFVSRVDGSTWRLPLLLGMG